MESFYVYPTMNCKVALKMYRGAKIQNSLVLSIIKNFKGQFLLQQLLRPDDRNRPDLLI